MLLWLAVGWVGFALLPWYGLDDGILVPDWLIDGWAWDDYYAPALFQGLWHGKPWLLPLGSVPGAAAPGPAPGRHRPGHVDDPDRGRAGRPRSGGWRQGFGIGLRGIQFGWLQALLGDVTVRQFGMGWGALLTATAFLFFLTQGLAARGLAKGDGFVAGSIGLVVARGRGLHPLSDADRAHQRARGQGRRHGAGACSCAKFVDARIWSLGCFAGGALRRGLELAAAGGADRRRHDAARPRLRARSSPAPGSAPSGCCAC